MVSSSAGVLETVPTPIPGLPLAQLFTGPCRTLPRRQVGPGAPDQTLRGGAISPE